LASAWPRSLTHPTATGNLTSANTPAKLKSQAKSLVNKGSVSCSVFGVVA
jgi:hypothetical protein